MEISNLIQALNSLKTHKSCDTNKEDSTTNKITRQGSIQTLPPSPLKHKHPSLINKKIRTFQTQNLLSSQQESRDYVNLLFLQCAKQGQIQLCQFLLQRGWNKQFPNLGFRRFDGKNSLHLATLNGHQSVVSLLLQKFQLVDSLDFNMRTALHYACIGGNLTICRLLLTIGAKPNNQDRFGNTPAHYAFREGFQQLVSILVQFFCDLKIQNNDGLHCWEMAQAVAKHHIGNSKVEKVVLAPSVGLDEGIIQNEIVENSGDQGEVEMIESEIEIDEFSRGEFDPDDIEIIKKIGQGSFGQVYLVEYQSELYAMKIQRKTKIIDERILQYVIAERNVMAQINHPFIAKLKFAFQSQTKLYLVMQYYPGGDLSEKLDNQSKFSQKVAKYYIAEILLALQELHRHKVVYRDLKPQNVVLDQDGHAILTDFGLSKQGVAPYAVTQSFCGSIAYMAPQMLGSQGHGQSIDWYLLGVLLYEMLVGYPPFYNEDQQEMFTNIQEAELFIPNYISVQARSLLNNLLTKSPYQRLGRCGAKFIKRHVFFRDIDWEKVYNRELEVEKPQLGNIQKREVPQNLLGRYSLDSIGASNIPGWSFVNNNY